MLAGVLAEAGGVRGCVRSMSLPSLVSSDPRQQKKVQNLRCQKRTKKERKTIGVLVCAVWVR